MKLLIIPIVLGFMLLLFAAIGISGNLDSLTTGSRGGGAAGGVWVSTDDGRAFELRGNVEGDDDIALNREISSLVLGAGNETLFAVSPRLGLFQTNNRGQDWEQILVGDIETTAVAVNPNDNSEIYAGAVSGNKARIYKRSQTLSEWTDIYVDAVTGTEIVGLHVDPVDTSRVFGLLSNGTLIRSYNGGRDWVLASRVPVVSTGLYVDPRNPDILFVTSLQSIYVSTSGGFEFTPLNLRLSGNSFTGTQVSSFAMNPNDSSEIYVGSLGEISRSTNMGETWESVDILTPETNVPVQQIALNPRNTERLYYVAGSVLYASNNRGQSWTTRELPPGITTVSELLVDAQNNDILYISAR